MRGTIALRPAAVICGHVCGARRAAALRARVVPRPSHQAPVGPAPCNQAPVDETSALDLLLSRVEAGNAALTPAEAEQLVNAFTHERKPIRRRAADALAAAMRSGSIARALCERELDDTDLHRCWGAAFALHRAGMSGPRVIDAALATFELADGDVRWAAATILIAAARSDGDLRDRLRRLVSAPSATVRKMALLCLAETGELDASIYRTALRDEDTYVRLAGLRALGRLPDDARHRQETLDAVRNIAESDLEPAVRRAATAIYNRLLAVRGRT
jgi:hypothetical protein